jgi:hypothetical protein
MLSSIYARDYPRTDAQCANHEGTDRNQAKRCRALFGRYFGRLGDNASDDQNHRADRYAANPGNLAQQFKLRNVHGTLHMLKTCPELYTRNKTC